MEWTSPLKKPKSKSNPLQEELKKFKKPKCVISKACVKRITLRKDVDHRACEWVARWIEQLIRERCFPSSLLDDDFDSLLGKYFDVKDALNIIEQLRNDYRKAFPLTEPPDDDLSWVADVIRKDLHALELLPHGYLNT